MNVGIALGIIFLATSGALVTCIEHTQHVGIIANSFTLPACNFTITLCAIDTVFS